MTNSAYLYNPNAFSKVPGADWDLWRSYYKLYGYGVSFADRTGKIKLPIRTSVPDVMRLPKYNNDFNKSYDECCMDRVDQLVKIQDRLNVPIKIMYSGGIDSSVILTSFIKRLGVTDSAKRIIVLMEQESIHENPALWEKFIRPHFNISDSEQYGSELWTNSMVITGEGNDQLMGSDIYKDILRWGGPGILGKKWSETNIKLYLEHKGMTQKESNHWYDIFDRLISSAECSIETISDWWWYINFIGKWSNVYHRILVYSQDTSIFNHDYMNTYYHQFFNTEDFQQWSMTDRTHKHLGDFTSYKFHARDLIVDVIKDQRYSMKIKRPSLFNIIRVKRSCDVLDDNYNFHYNVNPMDFYNPDNDFVV